MWQPIHLKTIETDHVLKVKQYCGEAVQLVSQPEISESNVVEWSRQNVKQNLEQPHSRAVVENREWIDEVQDEEYHQSQGTGVRRDVEELTVQKG